MESPAQGPQLIQAQHESLHALSQPSPPVSVGFDAFLDRLYRVVLSRHHEQVQWMDRISQFRDRIQPSCSANFELTSTQQRLGGNAALLAQPLAALDVPTHLIATLGSAEQPLEIDPLFHDLVQPSLHLQSCGQHATTEALEFSDGKLMLGSMAGLLPLSWQSLQTSVGTESLQQFWSSADCVCLTNWTMTPQMSSLWKAFSRLQPLPHFLFIDLADPAKRADAELLEALQILQQMPCQVILGLNHKESQRVGALFGIHPSAEGAARLQQVSAALPSLILVEHRRDGAFWCSQQSSQECVSLYWPALSQPATLTGAGDHFNAGLVLGLIHRLSPLACLSLAASVAIHWVTHARELSREQLNHLLQTNPYALGST